MLLWYYYTMEKLCIYDGIQSFITSSKEEVKIFIKNNNIINLLYELKEKNDPSINIGVLDHADYKEPASHFLRGDTGIEESLCANSELYKIITSEAMSEYYKYNKKHLNKGMYLDRGFYIAKAKFNNGYTFDIVGATAPNKKSNCIIYPNFTIEENDEALKNRIDFLLSVAAANHIDIYVISSFGCNVYGQDINEVASIFKNFLMGKYKHAFKEVYFTDGKDENYQGWKKVFEDQYSSPR